MDGTPWKEVPRHGRVIFERTEFNARKDLPTDFIVEVDYQPEVTEAVS